MIGNAKRFQGSKRRGENRAKHAPHRRKQANAKPVL
jgi:hypothetical protein